MQEEASGEGHRTRVGRRMVRTQEGVEGGQWPAGPTDMARAK